MSWVLYAQICFLVILSGLWFMLVINAMQHNSWGTPGRDGVRGRNGATGPRGFPGPAGAPGTPCQGPCCRAEEGF